jgi:hypothetical protein
MALRISGGKVKNDGSCGFGGMETLQNIHVDGLIGGRDAGCCIVEQDRW